MSNGMPTLAPKIVLLLVHLIAVVLQTVGSSFTAVRKVVVMRECRGFAAASPICLNHPTIGYCMSIDVLVFAVGVDVEKESKVGEVQLFSVGVAEPERNCFV